MKPLVLNKNSWHYKLANKVAAYHPYGGEGGDICDYVRHVMGAMLIVTIVIALFTFLSIPLIHMILGIGFSIWMGAWFFSDLGIMGLIIFGIVGGGLSLKAADGKYSEWKAQRRASHGVRRANYEPKPDGFVKAAYKSWKGKYCVQVKFVSYDHDDNLRAGQE